MAGMSGSDWRVNEDGNLVKMEADIREQLRGKIDELKKEATSLRERITFLEKGPRTYGCQGCNGISFDQQCQYCRAEKESTNADDYSNRLAKLQGEFNASNTCWSCNKCGVLHHGGIDTPCPHCFQKKLTEAAEAETERLRTLLREIGDPEIELFMQKETEKMLRGKLGEALTRAHTQQEIIDALTAELDELKSAERIEDKRRAGLQKIIDDADVEAKLRAELNDARAMVLRLVVSTYRDGWESGETEAETSSCAVDSLSNWGMDPHCDRENCKEILALNPEVSLATMRSNQELRKSAYTELEDIEAELNALKLADAKRIKALDNCLRWMGRDTRGGFLEQHPLPPMDVAAAHDIIKAAGK